MRQISFISAVLALMSLGALGVVSLVDTVDGPGTPRQEREAKTPDMPHDLRGLRQALGQAKHHVVTRYALKETFLRLNAAWKTDLLRHADTRDVMLGRDGYLFLASGGTIPLVQGLSRLDVTGRETWRTHFAAVRQAFEDQGLPYGLVIGPDKHSIYTDRLPEWLRAAPASETRTQDIFDEAASVFGARFTDLRPVLGAARTLLPEADLYHPTDTHWTELGAGLAMEAALAPLGLTLPVPDHVLGQLPRSGDLTRMLGKQRVPGPTGPELPRSWSCSDADGHPLHVETIDPLMPRRFTCGNPQGLDLRVVVFTDSFGVGTIPYLAGHFQQVDYIWTDRADPDLAADLKADLVLQVMVERKLGTNRPERFLKSDSK